MAWFLELSEVLKSLRHYLWAQSQWHHTIEKRGVERGSARWSFLKGRERAIVNQTNIGTISKAMLGKLLRDGVERIWAFPSTQRPSWTDLIIFYGCVYQGVCSDYCNSLLSDLLLPPSKAFGAFRIVLLTSFLKMQNWPHHSYISISPLPFDPQEQFSTKQTLSAINLCDHL